MSLLAKTPSHETSAVNVPPSDGGVLGELLDEPVAGPAGAKDGVGLLDGLPGGSAAATEGQISTAAAAAAAANAGSRRPADAFDENPDSRSVVTHGMVEPAS